MPLTRRMILAGLLASGAAPALARAPLTSPRPLPRPDRTAKVVVSAATDLIRRARLGGQVGFVVADTATGEILESHNPLLALPPASTAKALTALYALDALGPDHRFETRLVATGPIRNGRLHGDLVLVGGGDPTLDTEALGTMAAALKDTGLREITGRFLVSGGGLPQMVEIDPEQPDHVGYNPSVGGLNLNFNRVHFEWKRAGGDYNVTMEARSARFRPRVGLSRMQVIRRAVPVYTYSPADGRDNWTVARSALGNGGARWLPVRRPDLYAGEVFMTLARAQGIDLGREVIRDTGVSDQRMAALDGAPDRGGAVLQDTDPGPGSGLGSGLGSGRGSVMGSTMGAALGVGLPPSPPGGPDGKVLVKHRSARLDDLLRGMLKYSNNLTAEVIGLSTSMARSGQVRDLAGSAAQMNAWLKDGPGAASPRLIDHSGLGDESRISSRDMVRTLIRTAPDNALRPILKPFALNDRPDVQVVAKTGTLNFVSALTGYIKAPGGSDLAFAIFCADRDRRDLLTEAQRERPEGGKAWSGRARTLQRRLLARWGTVYGA